MPFSGQKKPRFSRSHWPESWWLLSRWARSQIKQPLVFITPSIFAPSWNSLDCTRQRGTVCVRRAVEIYADEFKSDRPGCVPWALGTHPRHKTAEKTDFASPEKNRGRRIERPGGQNKPSFFTDTSPTVFLFFSCPFHFIKGRLCVPGAFKLVEIRFNFPKTVLNCGF